MYGVEVWQIATREIKNKIILSTEMDVSRRPGGKS